MDVNYTYGDHYFLLHTIYTDMCVYIIYIYIYVYKITMLYTEKWSICCHICKPDVTVISNSNCTNVHF